MSLTDSDEDSSLSSTSLERYQFQSNVQEKLLSGMKQPIFLESVLVKALENVSTEVIGEFFKDYIAPGYERIDADRKLMISSIVDKYFGENESSELKRLKEGRNLEGVVIEKEFFQILGLEIPSHVFVEILCYLRYDRTLVESVGSVNKSWYLIVLGTWKRLSVSEFTRFHDLPLIIRRSVRELTLSNVPLGKSLFKMVNTSQLTEIRFEKFRVSGLTCQSEKRTVSEFFESCITNNVTFYSCRTFKFPENFFLSPLKVSSHTEQSSGTQLNRLPISSFRDLFPKIQHLINPPPMNFSHDVISSKTHHMSLYRKLFSATAFTNCSTIESLSFFRGQTYVSSISQFSDERIQWQLDSLTIDHIYVDDDDWEIQSHAVSDCMKDYRNLKTIEIAFIPRLDIDPDKKHNLDFFVDFRFFAKLKRLKFGFPWNRQEGRLIEFDGHKLDSLTLFRYPMDGIYQIIQKVKRLGRKLSKMEFEEVEDFQRARSRFASSVSFVSKSEEEKEKEEENEKGFNEQTDDIEKSYLSSTICVNGLCDIVSRYWTLGFEKCPETLTERGLEVYMNRGRKKQVYVLFHKSGLLDRKEARDQRARDALCMRLVGERIREKLRKRERQKEMDWEKRRTVQQESTRFEGFAKRRKTSNTKWRGGGRPKNGRE